MEKSLKSLPLKYLLLLFIFFSQYTFSQCIATNEQCAPVNEWEFSFAIGAGVLTNPLHGGSNTPLVLIPNISYYGEKLFFENNALGYTVYEKSGFSLSAISLINRENSFFNRWHPNNVFVPSIGSGISDSSQDSGEIIPGVDEPSDLNPGNPTIKDPDTRPLKIELEDVANRKWALDAGIQADWFLSEKNHLTIRLLHDVNNTYNGFNGKIEFGHHFTVFGMSETQWKLTTGINWLSKQQTDYYYGIGARDKIDPNYFYHGKSALNPYIKIKSNYKLNNNWRLTFTIRSEFLGKGISDSPLVKDEIIKTLFLGVVYAY